MKTNFNKFIILSMKRSGSNNLSYLLSSHPQIFSIGEIYCVEKIWGEPALKWMNHSHFYKFIRDHFPTLFLKFIVFGKKSKGIRAVGFRFFYEHAEKFTSVVEILKKDPDLKVIHLKRDNMLENLVSLKLAIKTGAWSTLRKVTYGKETLYISYDECLQHFKESNEFIKKYALIFKKHPTLTITYDQLTNSFDKELKKIQDFLGVKSLKLSSPLKKQNTRSLSEIIENYQDLKSKFRNTQWAEYFLN